jgi:hypothetical protein
LLFFSKREAEVTRPVAESTTSQRNNIKRREDEKTRSNRSFVSKKTEERKSQSSQSVTKKEALFWRKARDRQEERVSK